MTEEFIVSRHDGIVTATFSRPLARNALTFAMYERLAALCREIDADTTTKVLILAGAGGEAFAAGTDIAQFLSFRSEADALAYETRIEEVLSALETCRVPTIAAMAGACTGGGAMIAICCDLRLASANLKFGFPIARTLGNGLSAQNLARLVALFGEARVKAMIFTARLIEADEARIMGLVSGISASPADLSGDAEALARIVVAHAPLTLLTTKQALHRQRRTIAPSDDLLLACYLSDDFREGVSAFVARRKPRWTGR